MFSSPDKYWATIYFKVFRALWGVVIRAVSLDTTRVLVGENSVVKGRGADSGGTVVVGEKQGNKVLWVGNCASYFCDERDLYSWIPEDK